jgi:hypothetical protein
MENVVQAGWENSLIVGFFLLLLTSLVSMGDVGACVGQSVGAARS